MGPKAVRRAIATVATVVCATQVALAQPLVEPAVEQAVQAMASALARDCPLADASDQSAFDACRAVLFKSDAVRTRLSNITLWGRQRDPGMLLKNTPLTQFAPDALTGMYMPLFMFDGSYSVSYSEANGMVLARLGAAFRNRLPPGQFPYPFWHDAQKWATYENAKSMLFWIDPKLGKIKVVQFTALSDRSELQAVHAVARPAFDGQWIWTDTHGKTQPAVTLFDGLFSSNNPYRDKLDQSYRTLALSLRESQCLQCHVPNNPKGLNRLVLLQSPAHAAAEIKRLMRQVRDNRMPVDEFGLEDALDPALKSVLLQRGQEFEEVVDAAHAWERASHP